MYASYFVLFGLLYMKNYITKPAAAQKAVPVEHAAAQNGTPKNGTPRNGKEKAL